VKKYLRQTFGRLTDADLQKVEFEFGKLPLIYRDFLLSQNGGIAHLKEGGQLLLYGIYDGPNDLRSILRERTDGDASGVIPIGEDDNGDHLLLLIENGNIVTKQGNVTGFSEFFAQHCIIAEEESLVVEAIECQRLDLMETLFNEKRVDVNNTAKFGYSLIQYAVLLGKEGVVEFLAKKGARADGCLAILLAKGKPTRPLLKLLLENGASISERMIDGTPILESNSPWVRHIRELYAAIVAERNASRLDL
jgi:hypothetical protein